jgi:hypothetical protein
MDTITAEVAQKITTGQIQPSRPWPAPPPRPEPPAEVVTDYAQILTAEDEYELIQARENLTSLSWFVGDLINRKIQDREQIPDGEARVPVMIIYGAVASRVGKTASRVRRWAYTAEFYEPETRAEFSGLAFGHFEFAKSLPRWREVLEWAADNNASLDATMEHFLPTLQLADPRNAWVDQARRLIEKAEMLPWPAGGRERWNTAKAAMMDALEVLKNEII